MAKRRRKKDSSLTPEDVAGIRDALGLDVDEFAEVMGVVPQAVIYWEDGRRAIPRTPAILMQIFEEQPHLMGRFEND